MKANLKIFKVILFVLQFSVLEGIVMAQEGKVTQKPEENIDFKKKMQEWLAIYGSMAGPDLEASLGLLTFFEPEPQWKLDMTKRAYEIFSVKPDVRYADLFEDQKFREICDSQKIKLLGGPMLGQISETGASVWVRTYGSASVTVRVKKRGGYRHFGPVVTRSENDFTAVVKITGLQPNKSYSYSVYLNGIPVPRAEGMLKTADPKQTRIVFGSCSHRHGLANPMLWDKVLSRNPNALLLMGDVIVQNREFNFGMHRFDFFTRDMMSPWRHTVANLPVYASWDDHDYLNNDLSGLGQWGKKDGTVVKQINGTDSIRLEVRRVFQTSWNNPSYGFNNDKGGIFFRTRIGAADVIMTDNRYFRGTDGPFLGSGQLKWLEEQLLECKGPFIIITCGTMWSDYKSGGKDSWGIFDPEGRERLFNFIEKNHIPGVLLLSGDRHGARGFKIPRPSGYTYYEFETASLGGIGTAEGPQPEWGDNYLYGIQFKYAFGEFTFDARSEDPTVTFRLIMEDGSEYYKIKLTRSQLTP